MPWVSLILDFLARVAWPLLLGIVLVVYRKELQSFLSDVEEVAFSSTRIKRAVRQAAGAVRKEAMTVVNQVQPPAEPPAHLAEAQEAASSALLLARPREIVVADHPASTVMTAGDFLHQAAHLADIAVRGREASTAYADPTENIRRAGLAEELCTLVGDLWSLRQRIVSGLQPVDAEGARDFLAATQDAIDAIFTAVGLRRPS